MLAKFLAILIVAACSGAAWSETWHVVASEQGKSVEIDRDSIVLQADGSAQAKGRIVLDKPIVDPKTSASYRIIETLNRFQCTDRTHATLQRTYFKEAGEVLRQEEVRNPVSMPVHSGTPDDRLLREACRPRGAAAGETPTAGKALEKIEEVSGDLRKANEAMVGKAVKEDLQRLSRLSNAVLSVKSKGGAGDTRPSRRKKPAAPPAWAYVGGNGPDQWGKLDSAYALCASGRRQSPIDIRDGIRLDLEPIQFFYPPAAFKVVDSGWALRVDVASGGIVTLGKEYALAQIVFHRPAETLIAGKTFALEAQLLHKSADGKMAIVSVLFDQGEENAFVQTVLNNLPLERRGAFSPPALSADFNALLPAERGYYSFMGSQSTPPCSEEVLWLVLKQPQHVSQQQIAIFERLYQPNARPAQADFGRIIKESR